jgi:hypothetical protein
VERYGWITNGVASVIAADAPALSHLTFGMGEGDFGLSPVFAALPQNTHLRSLVWWWDGMNEEFVNEELLPAVRANTSLRHFQRLWVQDGEIPEHEWHVLPAGVLEAEALVAQRPPMD